MPDLILTGFVKTPSGPEAFECYRVTDGSGGFFTVVDQKLANQGWVTHNAGGGLAGFAAQHGVFYPTLDAYQQGSSQPFPQDDLAV